jgi:hypothetical protein
MRTKILGLAFLAILAINALALTATASAVEALLVHFLPEPTKEKPVSFTDKGGEGHLFELGNKEPAITCAKNTSKGEFTTLHLGTIEIKFEKCKLNATKSICEDLGKALKEGIVAKGAVHVQTGLLSEKEVPALTILPEALHFTCGVVLFLILQSKEDPSCVAGLILETNKLLSVVKVQFIQDPLNAGDQDIKKVFEDNDKTEYTCQLYFNISEGKLLDGAIEQLKNEEELENFKQGGVAVTALIDF